MDFQNFITCNQFSNEVIDPQFMPKRLDMAVNFYCCVEKEGKKYLTTYDYNPVWKSWYPFYDDVNKISKLFNCQGKTFEELIQEHNENMKIDIDDKINKAKLLFEKIFDCEIEIKSFPVASICYEIKYSKSQKLWTLYKLYNYIIIKCTNPQNLLKPKNMKCKLVDVYFDSQYAEDEKLATNMFCVVKNNIMEIANNAIKLI